MRLLALVLAPALAGCAAATDVAAFGVGAVAGSATANPAVGFAVGVATQAGLREVRRYVVRRRQTGEQDAIADAAGRAAVGATVPWEIRHTVPVGNEHGDLAVAREYATPLATCREVVFTVRDGADRSIFVTSLCRQAARWKWAAAEPATERWGYLQPSN
jgi:hypothetical protein